MSATSMQMVYSMSINLRATWQAHSLSNAGNNGSNRLLPRRQLLADGTETDACSGDIAKHHHAVLLAEYLESVGVPLCAACASRDGRRIAALVGLPDYEGLTIDRVLTECGLCDAHGFLVTAKNAASDGSSQARRRISKHTLIDFSYALALPDRHSESIQMYTRVGDSKEDGQMLMKKTARSGEYALGVRYSGVGVGVDTDKWQVIVADADERLRRHRAILFAMRDQILSPDGALTATMLPHLTGLVGAVVICHRVGRAAMISGLNADFVSRLSAMASEEQSVLTFDSVDAFYARLNALIETTEPCLPVGKRPIHGEAKQRGRSE